jgi:phosphoribosylamine-glycine ligase
MTQLKLLNKKILVLGAGHEQLPSIKLAKKLGLYVISVDKNKKCEGKFQSDEFANMSVKEKNKILKLIKKNQIKSIIAPCSDLAMKELNIIKRKLNHNNLSANLVNICTNKFHMKKFFNRNKLNTSKYFTFDNYFDFKKKIKKLNLPCVIKPLSSFGQKGVNKIENLKSIKKIIIKSKKYALNEKLICEEFIAGKEINIVVLIENSKIKILSLSERKTYAMIKGFGIAYAHRYPAEIKKIISNNIIKNVIKCIKKLKIRNGVLYPQIIIDKDENLYFIEIAARLPGGCMPELSLLASGYDIRLFEILHSLNIRNKLQLSKVGKRKKFVYVRFFTKKEIKNFKMLNLIKSKLTKMRDLYSITCPNIKKIPPLKDSSSRFISAIFATKYFNKKNIDYEKNFNNIIN